LSDNTVSQRDLQKRDRTKLDQWPTPSWTRWKGTLQLVPYTVKLAWYAPQSGHRIRTCYQRYLCTVRIDLCTVQEKIKLM
jgi:hypothetical protein